MSHSASFETATGRTGHLLSKRLGGQRLTPDEAVHLIKEASLLELGAAAHQARLQVTPPDIVTYVVDRNINYTNVCYAGCLFCAFYRYESDEDAYVLTDQEILDKVEEAVEAGATQILMQGGLNPEIGLKETAAIVRAVKQRFPRVQVHSLSPPEIVHLARLHGKSYEYVLSHLREAGLDSLPGGGAEILSDRVRHRLTAGKSSTSEWLEVMRAAHRLGIPSTATMMFGHVETLEERVEHWTHLRNLQDETGGFTAFIAWTYQSRHTALGGDTVGGYDYLRTIAVSRLFLDNFANHQASWLTQGLKVGQSALFFGCNDLGGTIMEEQVVRAAGAHTRSNEAELRHVIQAAGFRPVKRDTLYRSLE